MTRPAPPNIKRKDRGGGTRRDFISLREFLEIIEAFVPEVPHLVELLIEAISDEVAIQGRHWGHLDQGASNITNEIPLLLRLVDFKIWRGLVLEGIEHVEEVSRDVSLIEFAKSRRERR